MIKKCCCCGWAYNAKLSSCPLCGDVYKKTTCKACGKEIDYSTNVCFCLDCLIMSKRIYNRRLRKYSRVIKFDDGTVKLGQQFIKVSDEIRVSDAMFKTDLCDQKCDVCKYDKCILPED